MYFLHFHHLFKMTSFSLGNAAGAKSVVPRKKWLSAFSVTSKWYWSHKNPLPSWPSQSICWGGCPACLPAFNQANVSSFALHPSVHLMLLLNSVMLSKLCKVNTNTECLWNSWTSMFNLQHNEILKNLTEMKCLDFIQCSGWSKAWSAVRIITLKYITTQYRASFSTCFWQHLSEWVLLAKILVKSTSKSYTGVFTENGF